MVRALGAQTLGAGVYERLRAAVLEGRYQPGERLRPNDLCAEYDVGAGVVREALTRLAEQRLLVAEPNRGYRILSISRAQILDLVELRLVNECAALRLSIERGDIAWEGRVVATHHQMAATTSGDDPDVRARAHHDFHRALLSGCGNARLLDLCDELFLESELYRRWSGQALARATPPGRSPKGRAKEHVSLRDSALARDADRSAALYEVHLRHTAELALQYVATLDTVDENSLHFRK